MEDSRKIGGGTKALGVNLQDGEDKADLRWALERLRRELVGAQPGGVLVAQHLAHLMLSRP